MKICNGMIGKAVLFFLMWMAALFVDARPKVALVLGGGGAKGAAEIGVLKYIEQSGVHIDMIIGTSVGSMVGGLYSVGYRAAQLDSIFRSQEWSSVLVDRDESRHHKLFSKQDGVHYVLGVPVWRKGSVKGDGRGAIRGDSIVAYLDNLLDCQDSISFDSLPIPFRCTAVDVKTMNEVVLSSGYLSIAMRASMAIPMAFKPVKMDSLLLVDGGVLNNLPVDVARSMGADFVIAIDLTQKKHFDWDPKDYPDTIERNRWLGWLLKRPDRVKYKQNVASADIYINPQLEDCSPASFSKVDYMISQGEKAGKAALKKLIRLRHYIEQVSK